MSMFGMENGSLLPETTPDIVVPALAFDASTNEWAVEDSQRQRPIAYETVLNRVRTRGQGTKEKRAGLDKGIDRVRIFGKAASGNVELLSLPRFDDQTSLAY